MLTHEPSAEEIAAWTSVFDAYHARLKPNRKTGAELQAYLLAHYPLRPLTDAQAERVVCENILQNEPFARELPPGAAPNPVCFLVERAGSGESLYREQDACFRGIDIFVGLDLVTGFFCVEGSSRLWDELFAFRGLNEADRNNRYCVAEYVSCLERFGLLEQVLRD